MGKKHRKLSSGPVVHHPSPVFDIKPKRSYNCMYDTKTPPSSPAKPRTSADVPNAPKAKRRRTTQLQLDDDEEENVEMIREYLRTCPDPSTDVFNIPYAPPPLPAHPTPSTDLIPSIDVRQGAPLFDAPQLATILEPCTSVARADDVLDFASTIRDSEVVNVPQIVSSRYTVHGSVVPENSEVFNKIVGEMGDNTCIVCDKDFDTNEGHKAFFVRYIATETRGSWYCRGCLSTHLNSLFVIDSYPRQRFSLVFVVYSTSDDKMRLYHLGFKDLTNVRYAYLGNGSNDGYIAFFSSRKNYELYVAFS